MGPKGPRQERRCKDHTGIPVGVDGKVVVDVVGDEEYASMAGGGLGAVGIGDGHRCGQIAATGRQVDQAGPLKEGRTQTVVVGTRSRIDRQAAAGANHQITVGIGRIEVLGILFISCWGLGIDGHGISTADGGIADDAYVEALEGGAIGGHSDIHGARLAVGHGRINLEAVGQDLTGGDVVHRTQQVGEGQGARSDGTCAGDVEGAGFIGAGGGSTQKRLAWSAGSARGHHAAVDLVRGVGGASVRCARGTQVQIFGAQGGTAGEDEGAGDRGGAGVVDAVGLEGEVSAAIDRQRAVHGDVGGRDRRRIAAADQQGRGGIQRHALTRGGGGVEAQAIQEEGTGINAIPTHHRDRSTNVDIAAGRRHVQRGRAACALTHLDGAEVAEGGTDEGERSGINKPPPWH